MGETQVSAFIGQIVLALLLAVGWLVIAKVIPSLRRRIGVSYGIASAVALLACLVPFDGPTSTRFFASLFVVAILFVQSKRELRQRSMDTDTIISYGNHTLF
jgi:hypothetical protein